MFYVFNARIVSNVNIDEEGSKKKKTMQLKEMDPLDFCFLVFIHFSKPRQIAKGPFITRPSKNLSIDI